MKNTSFPWALRKDEQGMPGSKMFQMVSLVIVTQMTYFSTFWHILRHKAMRCSHGNSAH